MTASIAGGLLNLAKKCCGEFQGLSIGSHSRIISTSAAKLSTLGERDACLPIPLPPEWVPPCVDLRPPPPDCCIPQLPEFPPCDKICLPCCKKAAEPPDCKDLEVVEFNCKKLQYRIPSFTECRKPKLKKVLPKECCYYIPFCEPDRVGREGREPFLSAKTRMNIILGRLKKTRPFSTSAALRLAQEEDDDPVNCANPPALPCLKSSGKPMKVKGRKVCDKMCTPCCGKTRDPPECFAPFKKPPCHKLKPPRPSYYECVKDEVVNYKPCECCFKRPAPCEKLQGKKGDLGCGT